MFVQLMSLVRRARIELKKRPQNSKRSNTMQFGLVNVIIFQSRIDALNLKQSIPASNIFSDHDSYWYKPDADEATVQCRMVNRSDLQGIPTLGPMVD